MVKYPIQVRRSGYRGSNPRKREKTIEENRIADILERHINAMLQDQVDPIHVYMYQEFAEETGIALSIVRDLCSTIDGSHGGITAVRSDLTMQEAMELASQEANSDNTTNNRE